MGNSKNKKKRSRRAPTQSQIPRTSRGSGGAKEVLLLGKLGQASLHWGFCSWWCWTIDHGSWPNVRNMSEAMVFFLQKSWFGREAILYKPMQTVLDLLCLLKCEVKWLKNTHTTNIEYFLWANHRAGYSYYWYVSELPLEWDTNRFLGFTPQKIWFWGLNQAPYPMFLIGTLSWGWDNWLGTGWQAQLEDTSQVLMSIWITWGSC